MTLLTILLALVLVLAVLLAIPRRESVRSRSGRTPEIDEDELLQAEDQVRGLDVTITPEEAAEELPDWGPGAPRLRNDTDRDPQ